MGVKNELTEEAERGKHRGVRDALAGKEGTELTGERNGG